MSLSNQSASIGGVTKSIIVALDPNGNVASAHVTVNSSGVETGTVANPLTVSVGNQPTVQAVSAITLPLPIGASTAAGQPALNADGGALSHVTNLPAVQPISALSLPLPGGAATAANQPALNADGGAQTHVMNFPTTQVVSAASLPLPAGAATAANQPVLNADGGAQSHIMNFPTNQVVSAASLPLPTGAATAANQPLLNADGGAQAHVMNFPTSQVVSAASLPLPTGASTAANQPVLNADGGAQAHVMNFPTTQVVSAVSLPLPTGAATANNQPVLNADGGAQAHVMNFPTVQAISANSLPLPVSAAQDGTDATGVSSPAGASGIRGWLSGIYAKLSGTLSVGIATALPAGNNTLGAVTGSGTFTMVGQGAAGVAPIGAPIAVSGIDAAGLKQYVRTDTFGTPGDAAWSAGSGSLVSLGKALVAAQQATTAAITTSSLVPPSPVFVQTASIASNLVLKSAAGSLYACYVTTGSTAGFMMLFDATSTPANGTVAPKNCIYCPANATTEIELPFLTVEPFSTGITAVFSSTGPFTLTASSTVFIKGIVQ